MWVIQFPSSYPADQSAADPGATEGPNDKGGININPQLKHLLDRLELLCTRKHDSQQKAMEKYQTLHTQLMNLSRGDHLGDSRLRFIRPGDSGLAFYLDLHGHCSKRGCFVYGNWLDCEDDMVSFIFLVRTRLFGCQQRWKHSLSLVVQYVLVTAHCNR